MEVPVKSSNLIKFHAVILHCFSTFVKDVGQRFPHQSSDRTQIPACSASNALGCSPFPQTPRPEVPAGLERLRLDPMLAAKINPLSPACKYGPC